MGWPWKRERFFEGTLSHGIVEGQKVHLLLPMTYMNLSGQSVARVLNYFKMTSQDLLVVTDDIALSFAKQRLRMKGSAGGHNGLASIQAHLGVNYPRLRVGVGDREHGSLADHVLGKFTPLEAEQLGSICEEAFAVFHCWLKEGIEIAMNRANLSKAPKKGPALEEKDLK